MDHYELASFLMVRPLVPDSKKMRYFQKKFSFIKKSPLKHEMEIIKIKKHVTWADPIAEYK